jgi:hypothetical protein
MIVLKEMSFGCMGKRKTTYGLSTPITGELVAFVWRETGYKDDTKAEEEDKTTGDKL